MEPSVIIAKRKGKGAVSIAAQKILDLGDKEYVGVHLLRCLGRFDPQQTLGED